VRKGGLEHQFGRRCRHETCCVSPPPARPSVVSPRIRAFAGHKPCCPDPEQVEGGDSADCYVLWRRLRHRILPAYEAHSVFGGASITAKYVNALRGGEHTGKSTSRFYGAGLGRAPKDGSDQQGWGGVERRLCVVGVVPPDLLLLPTLTPRSCLGGYSPVTHKALTWGEHYVCDLRVSWWALRDSNPRPLPCKGSALPLS
jgi:hypothetical protein